MHSRKQLMMARFNLSMPETREMFVCCGTKFGKTLSAAVGMSGFFNLMSYGTIRHVAPFYSQTKIGMRYAEKLLPGKPHYNVNRSENVITPIDKHRSNRFEFMSGTDPERLEGEAVMRYVFDEFAKMKPETYESAQGTMTKTQGKAAYLSTPTGKNHFYQLCKAAEAEMLWCIANNKPITKLFIRARTIDNKHIPIASIEHARRNLPDRLFRQYYLAEFVDSGEVFANYHRCIFGPRLIFEYDNQLWFDESLPDDYASTAQIGIGADWGKQNDYTVFTAWDISSKRMIAFMRFRFIDYFTAVKNLVWFSQHWEDIIQIRHDKTGLGIVIDDILGQVDITHEGVTFTNKSKSTMINSLIMAFQRNIPRIPNWSEMITELDAFEVNVSEVGNFKYAASEGFHDDIVCSMILGWSIVQEHGVFGMDAITLDQLLDIEIESIDLGEPSEDFSRWRNS